LIEPIERLCESGIFQRAISSRLNRPKLPVLIWLGRASDLDPASTEQTCRFPGVFGLREDFAAAGTAVA